MVSKYLIIVLRICYADDELNRINPLFIFCHPFSLFLSLVSIFYLACPILSPCPLSHLNHNSGVVLLC